MVVEPDEIIATRLRAAISEVGIHTKELERRGYTVRRSGKKVHITKVETKTTEL